MMGVGREIYFCEKGKSLLFLVKIKDKLKQPPMGSCGLGTTWVLAGCWKGLQKGIKDILYSASDHVGIVMTDPGLQCGLCILDKLAWGPRGG